MAALLVRCLGRVVTVAPTPSLLNRNPPQPTLAQSLMRHCLGKRCSSVESSAPSFPMLMLSAVWPKRKPGFPLHFASCILRPRGRMCVVQLNLPCALPWIPFRILLIASSLR